MADKNQQAVSEGSWRQSVVLGAAIGFGIGAARGVTDAWEPTLGWWGAFLLGLFAAGAVGGLVALVLAWLFPVKAVVKVSDELPG